MAEPRLISLHPKLAAFFDGLFSVVSLWWLSRIDTPLLLAIWFGVRLIWWFGLSKVTYYPSYLKRWHHLASLLIYNIGIIPFLVFSDLSNSYYSMTITRIFMVILPMVSFALIPSEADSLSVMVKPHRRWKFFMSLFALSGIWLAVEASVAFQIFTGWYIFASIFGAALFTVIISAWEWVEYGIKINSALVRLSAVMMVLFLELGAAVYLWPVGYFVSSFFMTWLWYILWLLFRFDLSEDGIRWEQQRGFIIANAALIFIFLTFIVRWK